MYVNLRKTAPAQKSSNLDPKASFAIPSKEKMELTMNLSRNPIPGIAG
jgi:hypothetical protein